MHGKHLLKQLARSKVYGWDIHRYRYCNSDHKGRSYGVELAVELWGSKWGCAPHCCLSVSLNQGRSGQCQKPLRSFLFEALCALAQEILIAIHLLTEIARRNLNPQAACCTERHQCYCAQSQRPDLLSVHCADSYGMGWCTHALGTSSLDNV